MQRISRPGPAAPAPAPPPPRAKTKPAGEFQQLLAGLRRGGEPQEAASRRTESHPDEPARRDAVPALAERDADRERHEPGGEQPGHGKDPELAAFAELVADPLTRALAQAGPRLPVAAEGPAVNAALPELEQLLGRLVRRAAWGGDGRRGTARLELGAGPLEGATLLVQADGGELTIDLELPPGAPVEEWRSRLQARLEARGLSIRELSVR